jgi:hypothetical protein
VVTFLRGIWCRGRVGEYIRHHQRCLVFNRSIDRSLIHWRSIILACGFHSVTKYNIEDFFCCLPQLLVSIVAFDKLRLHNVASVGRAKETIIKIFCVSDTMYRSLRSIPQCARIKVLVFGNGCYTIVTLMQSSHHWASLPWVFLCSTINQRYACLHTHVTHMPSAAVSIDSGYDAVELLIKLYIIFAVVYANLE